MSDKKMLKELTFRLGAYLAWCDEVYDYNFPVPKKVTVDSGGLYSTHDVTKVKRNSEPTIRGFYEWLINQIGTGA